MHGRDEGGFTLVELVFGAVIMALVVGSIGELFISNVATVSLAKARAVGIAVANEKMETLRDLPYDSLATANGNIYPPGTIANDETVVRNNYRLSVHTDIVYVDDPYDGVENGPVSTGPAAGKPKDLYPYDYKRAQVTVKLITSGKVVATLATDIAAKASETASNTGILSITVIDASGQPIPNANVTITNPYQSPAVNIVTTTDNNGLVTIPKLPPDSLNRYVVNASLPGYSSDGTEADPAGPPTAVKLNPNVLAQQITPVTLAIDRVSTLYIHVTDTSGSPKSNYNVITTGAKKIELNPDKFKYSPAAGATTDASGNITLSNMEWDSYSFAVPSGNYVVTSSPFSPAPLSPNSSTTVTLVVTTSSTYPTITSFSPVTQQTGTTGVSISVKGRNLTSGTTLKLSKSGSSDITATGCTSSGANPTMTLACTLNLAGAASGAWDVQAANGGGAAVQSGGFNVTP